MVDILKKGVDDLLRDFLPAYTGGFGAAEIENHDDRQHLEAAHHRVWNAEIKIKSGRAGRSRQDRILPVYYGAVVVFLSEQPEYHRFFPNGAGEFAHPPIALVA
ncbi:hypothetical protein D3C72_1949640 [compost metagenome]